MSQVQFDNVDINLNYNLPELKTMYNENYEGKSKLEQQIIKNNKSGTAYGLTGNFDHYHIATSQLYFPKISDFLKENGYNDLDTGIELACGTTTLFDYVNVKNCKLLELGTAHVEFMKNKGFDCYKGDIEDTPFGDKISDITVAANILNVNLSYNKAISEIKRITKDDGIIIIVSEKFNFITPISYLLTS